MWRSSDGTKHHYRGSIPFNKSDAYKNFSLRLYYDRPNLPTSWDVPWKVYNITIIPFEIKFRGATVSALTGSWNDVFNYGVEVNASKNLNITLKVFDPCTEEWPWKDVRPGDPDSTQKYIKNRWKKLNWSTDKNNPPFSENCSGKSKFYFKYEGGESQVSTRGPDLFKPPTFNNGSTNPNVTIYCNWSNSSTPCNFSVNVTTEDEYEVRLLVKDPTDKKWIPKGDVKDVPSETKNPVTWYDIKPFESLNIDNITQYIGKRANFTFEYDGHTYHEEFPGLELVAAFRDPRIKLKPGDEVINYNDTFNYSVNVIGSEKLRQFQNLNNPKSVIY